MHRITLTRIIHRDESQIAIQFNYDDAVKQYVKAFGGARWSQTHRCFYFKDSASNLHRFFTYLRKKSWYLDYSALKNEIKSVKTESTITRQPNTKPKALQAIYKELPKTHRELLTKYVKYLKGLRLSEQTLKVYGNFCLQFLNYCRDRSFETLGTKDVSRFVEDVIVKRNYSISSHRQCISALKHLGEFLNLSGLDYSQLKRPKKDKKLPTILSREELIALLVATPNLKHRTILALLYSAGLRIGELLSLRVHHIDLDRMQVNVKNAKGRKDRTVKLAQVLKPLLLNYYTSYKPTDLLIRGRDGQRYSDTSVRALLKRSCKNAGILKTVTPHTLRHSYATHMMDNGVALRHIQELLGHAKPETTMIYTHISQRDLLSVTNPLDVIVGEITSPDNQHKKVSISRQSLL
ncbi:MAG: integrase [Leeuwenhoekiella sp.]|nr:MAG: integrase [Leeuwenhoekiella sp.]